MTKQERRSQVAMTAMSRKLDAAFRAVQRASAALQRADLEHARYVVQMKLPKTMPLEVREVVALQKKRARAYIKLEEQRDERDVLAARMR